MTATHFDTRNTSYYGQLRRRGPLNQDEGRQLGQDAWQALQKVAHPATKSSVPISFVMLLLSAVVYGVLVFCMGSTFLPGGAAFATLLIWICSVVTAELAHYLRIPRVVGMLGSGLLLANVPVGVLAAFPAKWGVQMRAAALATIFLRCGLELEWKTIMTYKWPALRLAFLPSVAEALFDAAIATAIFQMPFTLAMSLGFILKAVGSGLVAPAMFNLQKQGWGAQKAIPPTVVIAASFNDCIAVTGFSIFINIAVATGDEAGWQIASGPLQVLFGILGGTIAGAILGATKVFHHKLHRMIGIYGAALLLMFFLEHFDMLSGGALGSLTVGLVACLMWEQGRPARYSLGPSAGFSVEIERYAALVWNWVMEPMLFATIGASIVFSQLSSGTIPKALIVVCTGLCLRTIATWCVMGKRYNWKERLFFALAWTPKATVQAALSSVPLSLINRTMVNSPNYADWVRWGNDVLVTGNFAIVVCATLGSLLIYWLAPFLLEKSSNAAEDLYNPVSRLSTGSLGTIRKPKSSRSLDNSPQPSWCKDAAAVPVSVPQDQDMWDATEPAIIQEYFDAVQRLVAFTRQRPGALQDDDGGLGDAVLRLQEAIARNIGPREPTARQMLQAALSHAAATSTAAAADAEQSLPGPTDAAAVDLKLQGSTSRCPSQISTTDTGIDMACDVEAGSGGGDKQDAGRQSAGSTK